MANIKVGLLVTTKLRLLRRIGTWVPLESGMALARANNVYDKLRTIFEYEASNASPPPAPKHTTAKPKQPKKPAVPKFSNSKLVL